MACRVHVSLPPSDARVLRLGHRVPTDTPPRTTTPNKRIRLLRGLWMVLVVWVSREADVFAGMMSRKLAAGAPPHSMVAQAVVLTTLVPFGQCCYWPLPFRCVARALLCGTQALCR